MIALGPFWKDAVAPAFGLDVVVPFSVALPDGRAVQVDVLLRHFGPPNGMLLVDDFAKIGAVSDILVALGYGYSALGAPASAAIDKRSCIEMLADWGWSGPSGARPLWLVGADPLALE